MRSRLQVLVATLVMLASGAAWLSCGAVSSMAAVVTYGGSSARTALYPSMRRVSPALLSSHRFGRLFDRTLPDHGAVYAQPLLAGGRLVVVTERNDVYELDPRTGRILRSRALAPPWDSVFPSRYRCPDLQPTVGVTSTPVIDTARGIIYLTAKTAVPASQATVFNQATYLMYALRLSDLHNAPGFGGGNPVSLSGLSPPSAPSLRFDPTFQLQRPALLETAGTIFAGFGGLCDTSPYLGWVLGIRGSDGAVTGRWATPTATGARGAGIWMGGAGLASDGPGRIFFTTGNGFNAPGTSAAHTPTSPTPGNRPPSGLASSVIQLQSGKGGSLASADFFTPCNALTLDGAPNLDLDVSSGGVALLPGSFGSARHRSLLLAGGKSGTLYVLDRRHLGGFRQGASSRACAGGGDASAATLRGGGAIWGASAVWPGDGGWVIVPTESPTASNNPSRGSLEFIHGHLGTLRLGAKTPAIWGGGSGSPVVTSIGTRNGSALVWGVSRGIGAPRLRAFSAAPNGRTPRQLASFPVGAVTKFAPPGVGSDEIFVGGDGHVVAFGPRRR